ncbi:peptidoglycan DD-metalloendopeptidase family protein [Streptomyces sp. E11-3]|uniref:LysM peptidoglycan-binding domain-containing M23 family metallopeptidase n=1 Tax=Streptomyces sp. E11-3 TaxID=3110112 RepID=UPI00397EEC2A
MPAKGKHRRPKSARISRQFAVVGTGGAALALPLFAANSAQAAPSAAPATAPAAAQQAAPAAAPQTAPAAAPTAAPQAAGQTYSVVSGDSLSRIADKKDVDGGWKKLYQDNRSVVGEDPSLILPGMKLKLGAADSQASAPAKPKAKTEAKPQAKAKPAASTSTASKATKAATTTGFTAPVAGGVSTQYRASGAMWSSGYHTGTDFAAPSGTPIKAVGAGTVVSAGWSGSYGNEVVIRHADGHYSQYAHMSSLGVSAGQSVSGGQQIGLVGSTGNSTGPHLHFEIRTGQGYGSDVDPLAYLRSHGVSI